MARHYELVLMLDPELGERDRDKLADEARRTIEDGGSVEHADTWGVRNLAYEIRRRTEADYRLFRFQGGKPVLDALDHSLKIADGVLRFRIFGVDPSAPIITPPAGAPPVAAGERRGREE